MIGRKGEANRSTRSASTGPLPFTLLEDSFDLTFKRSREPINPAPARSSPKISDNAPPACIRVAETIASQQCVREPINETSEQPSLKVSEKAQSPSMGAAESIASQQPQKELVCVSRQDEPRRFVVALPAEEDEIVAYVAVTRGSTCNQVLRLAQESAYPVIVPIRVDLASDGRITLTVLTFSETFAYDSRTRAWIGDGGSRLIGGSDLFDQRTGWTITVRVHNVEGSSVSISHNGKCKQGTLGGLSLKH